MRGGNGFQSLNTILSLAYRLRTLTLGVTYAALAAVSTAIASSPDTPGLRHGWRQSKRLILVELLVVILLFVADAKHWIPWSKTPFLLVVAWLSLRLRKLRWRDVGLSRYRSWPTTLAAGFGVGLLLEAFQLFVSQPILVGILKKQPDLELFRVLRGDVKWTLLAIAGAWTGAAFREEMVYRGYLVNRVGDLMNRTRWAWIVSLFVVHVGFGLAHSYQGITGIRDEGLAGFLFGVVYLRNGRNWPCLSSRTVLAINDRFLADLCGKVSGDVTPQN